MTIDGCLIMVGLLLVLSIAAALRTRAAGGVRMDIGSER